MKFLIMILSLSLLATGCGEHAAKGAGEGATVGAVSGAVGGLVSALVFGGDPAEAAARGAVYGGAVGATAGAMSGSKADAKIEEQRNARAETVRAKIGDDAFEGAFEGLRALVTCDHQDALQDAANAKQSANPNFAVAGYWLEVLIYADQGDSNRTKELIPGVVEKDWETGTEAEARTSLLTLQDQLMTIREEYRLPKQCA